MLTSLDGKIDGDFFAAPETLPALNEYGKLRGFYDCDATLYGTTTMLGGFCAGEVGELPKAADLPREDFIAQHDVDKYLVSLDPNGILAFDSPYSERKGRPRTHIIEVLTESVSDDYLAYLRGAGVSYIFAGNGRIDCQLLLHKLKTLFKTERLMIAGGGVTNWSFAAENLIDELSIVIAPTADGSTKSASIFEEFGEPKPPVAFILKEAKPLDGNALWLRYLKKEN